MAGATVPSSVTLASIRMIAPITALAPTWLSCMISSFRSRVLPLNTPSDVSIKPSYMRVPMKKSSASTRNTPSTFPVNPMARPTLAAPHMRRPMIPPTNGKYGTDRAKSSGNQTSRFVIRIRVRNSRQVKKSRR